MKLTAAFILIVLIVAACGTSKSLLQPTESDASKVSAAGKTVSLEELQTGYHLYLENCSGCHMLFVPSAKKKSRWEQVLPEMFSKTQLDQKQQELVRQYIFSKL